MASTAGFIIVSRNDIPIYEAEVGSALKKEEAAHQHEFILHMPLDIVQDLAWTKNAMFLKAMDRFNDLAVSVYITAGAYTISPAILLGCLGRADQMFYFERQQIFLNPLYLPGCHITSSHFDTKA